MRNLKFIYYIVVALFIGIAPSWAQPNFIEKIFSPPYIENFPRGSLTINSPKKLHNFTIEIASSREEITQGLMFRKSMPENHGMLFIFPRESMLSFWMKNTYIPLDMLFINAKKEIIHIHEHAKPHDKTLISTPVAAMYVLELNAGTVSKLNLQKDDFISFKKE